MSTLYQSSKDVPTKVLADRLDELADVVSQKRDRICSEFTMRIPAECDRDADLVMAEAARRLREMPAESKGEDEFLPMPTSLRREQETASQADGWDAEAYNKMRAEIMWWKEKADKAEELIERLRSDLSPTHMGEPVLPKEGQSWSGWACQAHGRMPRLYGSREIAELNFCPESGDRLFFLSEPGPAPQPTEQKEPDSLCIEDDGCPTERAVLQRFWRKHHQPAEHQPDVTLLLSLLSHARCNTCDGSGGLYDNHGQPHQCQWCHDRSAALAAYRKEDE